MKKVIVSMLLPIFVLACDKDGNLGREESPVWHKRVSTEEKVEYFTPKCLAYGFKKGTPELQQCVVNEIRISEAEASAKMRAIQANRPINCRTYGNNTTCY